MKANEFKGEGCGKSKQGSSKINTSNKCNCRSIIIKAKRTRCFVVDGITILYVCAGSLVNLPAPRCGWRRIMKHLVVISLEQQHPLDNHRNIQFLAAAGVNQPRVRESSTCIFFIWIIYSHEHENWGHAFLLIFILHNTFLDFSHTFLLNPIVFISFSNPSKFYVVLGFNSYLHPQLEISVVLHFLL